jgi:hypothetical protein
MVMPLLRQFGNYSFLLIVLVLMMLLHPLVDTGGQAFISVAFTLVFLAGIYAVRGERRTLITGLVLVVPALLTGWAGHAVDSRALFAISRGLEALFLFYVTAVILHQVMTESKITQDTIFGAAAAYLMIGIAFAVIYGWLETFQPGALRGLTLSGGDWGQGYDFWEFVYFSARSLATLQAVAGQFYVAVLVARIVAILSSRPRQPSG